MDQRIATSPNSPGARRSRYHHGNLRQNLLSVARDEIARNGAQSVSLTSLARLAGVSQPAPYRHFADRESLLKGVALLGFQEFSTALTRAAEAAPPLEALRAIASAYVDYSEANIEIYRLMFASRLVPQSTPDSPLGEAADAAFDTLNHALLVVYPAARRDDAYFIWAQLHGLVMLKADGFINRPLREFAGQAAWLNRILGDPT